MGIFKRFKTDQSGATAVVFGLSILPMFGFVGAAIDYGRASDIQTRFQRSVDAAALALVSAPKGATGKELTDKAQAVFDSAFRSETYVATVPVFATRDGTRITVSASGTVTNAFLQVLGRKTTEVAATSSVKSERPNIELAMVLDNTGSMGDRVFDGRAKMDWLKDQAKSLIDDLRSVATKPNSVRVSIVPFDTQVRLDPARYRNKDWFRFDQGVQRRDWTGYVIDRFYSYATRDDAPNLDLKDTLFPAVANNWDRELQAIRPLTSVVDSAEALKTDIDNMQPRGMTNIALGVMWGLATLSRNEPFNGTAEGRTPEEGLEKFMIVLTDGKNTKHYVNGQAKQDETGIDQATKDACTLAKSSGASNPKIEIFTIRLVEGNQQLLTDCAGSADNFFDVKKAKDLKAAFEKIRNRILRTRITA